MRLPSMFAGGVSFFYCGLGAPLRMSTTKPLAVSFAGACWSNLGVVVVLSSVGRRRVALMGGATVLA